MSQEKFSYLSILFGVLTFFFALPLYLGKVKRNTAIGIKIHKAYESEENWYKIHNLCGKLYLVNSVVLILIGILTLTNILDISYQLKQIIKITYLILYIYPLMVICVYSMKL